MILALVDEAVTSGARLFMVCRQLVITARMLQRWRKQGHEGGQDRRVGPRTTPKNKLPEADRTHLLEVLNSAPYRDLSPKQIVPRLADNGIYLASESTMYRVLEAAGQNNHRQPTKPRTNNKPEERVADGPAQLLCWDITYLLTTVRGHFFYLYVFLDIWSRKIVGWGVNDQQCGEFAAELLLATCDGLGVDTDGIVLHSDNGKPMKGSSMLSTMQWLGIVPSFSRPHVSDDNPYVESLFRTLKYRPGGADLRFDSLEDAVRWVEAFVRWYNHEHLHSGIGFVTPNDRHTGRDIPVLQARRRLYKRANRAHPERWTGKVRAWHRTVTVRLHPDRQALELKPKSERRSA
jgi:transposase InsO family protein